jgi:DNA polymerase-3 subunit epsilon
MLMLPAPGKLTLRQRLADLLQRGGAHPVIARNRQLFSRLDQNLPLEAYDFAVVDTELSGLNPRRHEIVSIGAVRIRKLEIVPQDSFHRLIRPNGGSTRSAVVVHGLTPENLEQAEPLDKVLPQFLEYMGASLMVGHHVRLDAGFIHRACKRLYGRGLATPRLDTLRLAQAYQEEQYCNRFGQYAPNISFTLPDLAETYGLPRFPAHDAAMDALQTAYLFLFLVKKLQRGGVRTLRDLYRVNWRWRMGY